MAYCGVVRKLIQIIYIDGVSDDLNKLIFIHLCTQTITFLST